MSVSTLFAAITKRKSDQTVSTFAAYRDLLIEMAEEKNVDPIEAEHVLEAHGKDREQFEHDVERMAKRLRAVATLEATKNAQSALASAESQIRAITAERETFLIASQQKLNVAVAARQAASSAVEQRHTAQSVLATTAIDPAITLREAELSGRRKQIQDERLPIIESLNPIIGGTTANCLRVENGHVEKWTDKVKRSSNGESNRYCQAELDRHVHLAKTFQTKTDLFQKRLDELHRELEAIHREQTTLEAKKLIA